MTQPASIPSATSTGTETYVGVTDTGHLRRFPKPSASGPAGATGATGPTTIGGGGLAFATRAAHAAATVDGTLTFAYTAGYSTSGDGGHGVYKRLSAAPADPTNRAYIRSVDRYKLDGTTDATHGGYWQLVPEGGAVRIEQFGGVADYAGVPASATDSYTALTHAKAFTALLDPISSLYRTAYKILFGAGAYYISQRVDFFECVHLLGTGSGQITAVGGRGTRIYFPPAISWMVFHQNNTGPNENDATGGLGSSGGSIVEGLALIATGAHLAVTDLTKTAMLMRTTIQIRNVYLQNCPGKGFWWRAYAGAGGANEGNTNQWRMENCTVHSSRGDALHVEGADANGGSCTGFVTGTEVAGCGVRNASYFTNNYSGLQITGYGNQGVHRLGKYYVLVSSTAGAGEATTPGTDSTVWYHFANGTPTTNYPDWTATPTVAYALKNPIWDSGGGSVYDAIYVETASGHPSHIPATSILIGGNVATTNTSSILGGSASGAISQVGFIAQQQFLTGTTENTVNGALTQVSVGGKHADYGYGTNGGQQVFFHQRLSDTGYTYGYHFGDLAYRSASPIYKVTTRNGTSTFGGNATRYPIFTLYDFGIQDPNNSNNARIFGIRDAVLGAAGEYVRGNRYWNVAPTIGGTQGWVCTQSGVIASLGGIWVSGTVYSGGDIIPTDTGNFYRNASFGTSTNKPTHTSGDVTYADGLTWSYLGNSAPLFAPVMDVPTGMTVTADTPTVFTQTWNNAGVTFTGLKANFTSTASAAGSIMLDLQIGGTSKWKVDKAGAVTQTGGLTVAGAVTGATTLDTTGLPTFKSGTAPAAGGTQFVQASSTAGLGFYFGTGAPTISAGKGSIYSNTTATTTTTRLYVNTDGGTTWTNFTAAA